MLDTLPTSIEIALSAADIPLDKVRFGAQSDLNPDGLFGESWFVLTDTEILGLDAEGAVLHRVPYSEVVEVRSEAVVDGGLLVLEMMGDALDLIRYSNGLMPKFGYIAKFLSEEIEAPSGEARRSANMGVRRGAEVLQDMWLAAARCIFAVSGVY